MYPKIPCYCGETNLQLLTTWRQSAGWKQNDFEFSGVVRGNGFEDGGTETNQLSAHHQLRIGKWGMDRFENIFMNFSDI